MSAPPLPPENPYQSPSTEIPSFAQPGPPGANLKLYKLLSDFRSQILALGVFWIAIGGVVVGAAVLLFTQVEIVAPVIVGLLAGIGLVWMALGLLACLKHLWAVYVALVLSYLSVIGNLVNFNLCGLVILGAVIVQAHRVIGWAKELQRAGIPLNTQPKDLQVPINIPSGG
jgi:large-conductance mechanosensitive channel